MDLFDKQEIILKKYITEPDINLKIDELHVLHREINPDKLLKITKCPPSTTLKPKRDLFTGKVIDFVEVRINNAGENSTNSMSLKRAPGPMEEIRGSSTNFPFWPGGFERIVTDLNENKNLIFDFETDKLLTVPPSFDSGYDFKNEFNSDNNSGNNSGVVDLLDALEKDLEINEWLTSADVTESETNKSKIDFEKVEDDLFPLIDHSILEETLPIPVTVLDISNKTGSVKKQNKWCEMINIEEPINFKEKIPNPALTYEFELDPFQKHAIVKLEEKEYVFVAAHTSAGKTVVAEYAIALSQTHMTRAIYTSPIKALSNQKYRDFKQKFKDVGLITGDRQIDPTSSCLIMTTEILRSMLFCGSDITRDIEFVIFDEVHYINDAERGHVWEEVIMLLPDHAQIIMLSATVPNSRELADWVGSIKKRKVYVISTLKRPVPLVHYLYTGCGSKSKDDIFLIVDANGKFISENYMLAKSAKDFKSITKPGPKQEQTRWIGLINHLKKKDDLPVIAFTLSRNRCDLNVAALSSLDLNTAREKAKVEMFFNQCLEKLSPNDRNLNQIKVLKDSLERGIGVHHSGILPFLKEIVEMSFQRGLVKVLFATETFAMGINMPARTVIFDSHVKYDGAERRNLKPSEYTQMAGRAGRRGHDANGKVIILCKRELPDEFALKSIILGSPEPLQSKFLLRYAVILTCFRVERIKVEDILKHSFKQYSSQCLEPAIKQSLLEKENKLSNLDAIDVNMRQLSDFFDIANEYIKLKHKIMLILLSQPNNLKELKPGKVLIVTNKHYYNRLGILLSIKYSKDCLIKLLVLDHHPKHNTELKPDLWHNMLSLISENKIFKPEGVNGHSIIDITLTDIVEVTKLSIKIDADLIIKNWDQRQIERFKYDPPSATVAKALEELQVLNESYIKKPNTIKFMSLKKDTSLHMDNDILELLKSFDTQKEELIKILPYTNTFSFVTDFKSIYDRKILEQDIVNLKIKLSPESLSLYPDYRDKLEILRELKYIQNDLVTMKGKVASVMGQMELFLTEVILRNTFDNLDAPEIAALLSSLVFQAKTNIELKIPTKNIETSMKVFEEIDREITNLERHYNLASEKSENLNFGLVQVIYEWALHIKKPFSEIIKLTDIQEGIIVRCIQQLDEMVHDIKTASIHIGNRTLENKMDDVSNTIKRDIVFVPSLYTSL